MKFITKKLPTSRFDFQQKFKSRNGKKTRIETWLRKNFIYEFIFFFSWNCIKRALWANFNVWWIVMGDNERQVNFKANEKKNPFNYVNSTGLAAISQSVIFLPRRRHHCHYYRFPWNAVSDSFNHHFSCICAGWFFILFYFFFLAHHNKFFYFVFISLIRWHRE